MPLTNSKLTRCFIISFTMKVTPGGLCTMTYFDRCTSLNMLYNASVNFRDKESFLIYLKTVVLGPYLKLLPSKQLKDSFLTEIANHIEKNYPQLMWRLDYVRLNILATT